jgi:hypothetical protein
MQDKVPPIDEQVEQAIKAASEVRDWYANFGTPPDPNNKVSLLIQNVIDRARKAKEDRDLTLCFCLVNALAGIYNDHFKGKEFQWQ